LFIIILHFVLTYINLLQPTYIVHYVGK
jgi:hypothetical protein